MRRVDTLRPLLALSLGFGLIVPASAQVAAPQRKPGMWETTMVNSAMRGMSMKSQMCTDATVEKRFSALSAGEGPTNCTQSAVRKTATGWAFESTCRTGNRTSVTQGVASGDFNSNYKVELTSRITPPPPGGQPVMTSTITARWLGPCPAGRKPGDMVMPNGMVINMLTMQGQPR